MTKWLLTIIFISSCSLQVQAFEEYLLSTEGKLSKITVENSEILKIEPLITIDNSKNTLFITPLKEGQTSFSFMKNDNEKFVFDVKIKENNATFSKIEGFDIFSFDEPPVILDCNLDKPPMIKSEKKTDVINIDGAVIKKETVNKAEGK